MQFIQRGIITPENDVRSDVCIQSAMRWRNSLLLEISLVVLALTLGHRLFFDQLGLNASIWYATRIASSDLQLSLEGVLVCLHNFVGLSIHFSALAVQDLYLV